MSAAFLAAKDVSVDLAGRRVLHDFTFALPSRGVVALVGPNGAGKTTLLRAICGLIPSRGAIVIDGNDMVAMPLEMRAKKIAYLPQGHVVHWPLPVRDVVALGRFPHGAVDPGRMGEQDARIVEDAMAAADVLALADRRVTELSGGERSRVALARALAVGAPIVLADEPTASLDPRHQLDVLRLLRKTADAGALIVVVTHDIGMAARFANEVLVVSDGRLVAHGAPDVAFTDDILRDVFRVAAFRASANGEPILLPWSEA